MELVCFMLFDFKDPGGASIRMTGVINALVENGVQVTLYSRSNVIPGLSPFVNVIQLPDCIKQINKRYLQLALAYLSPSTINSFLKKQLSYFKKEFQQYHNQPILFFEYLDITLGYWLKKNNIIKHYIADVHGIAPLEFDLNETNSANKTLFNSFKKKSVLRLDKKIYANAYKITYTSKRVQSFLEKLYHINPQKAIIVNEGINTLLLKQKVDYQLREAIIKKINYKEGDTILFFAGKFKQFGGIADLVKAYKLLKEESPNLSTKLILVGYGELAEYCKKIVKKSKLTDEVFFLGPQPYNRLRTFHSIADIIICPDKDTPFSQYLPHIKYFDSIASGKIVINGKFEFTDEINPNECYSLNFTPSDIYSLKEVIRYAVLNKEELKDRYVKQRDNVTQKFSYNKNVEELIFEIKKFR